MKKERYFALALAATTALGVFAATTSVMANENNSTTVTFTKETADPDYTLKVPAAISGTKEGFTAADEKVSVVSEKFGTKGHVEVEIKTDNKLLGKSKKEELAYQVRKNDTVTGDLKCMYFYPESVTTTETDDTVYATINSGADFGINIADADWNTAPDDTYTGTINFVATYVK